MTYSIVARCQETGQLGVAVQSHYFGVGSIVPWVESGVGAVATQAMVEVAHGPDGLDRMRLGAAPRDALAALLAADPGADLRQVGMVDATGRAAAHTGSRCIAEASHVVGDGFTTEANMMERPGVAEAMASAFAASDGPLWSRLLGALDAAEALGGDIRGRQSAAIVVRTSLPSERPGHDVVLDVRVDDHPEPLVELRRLAELAVAYRRLDEAEVLLTDGALEPARAIYDEVLGAHAGNVEFAFWHALALAGTGQLDQARAALGPVFAATDGERWRELLRRLPSSGLVPDQVAAALLA